MKIACPKEVKNNEFRVGLTPASVAAYVAGGHEVVVEKGAGLGSAITDDEYKAAGAKILSTADEVWNFADMLIKVKEPLEEEYGRMKENQLVYTYFHFAADKPLLDACLKAKIIALAYETVQEGRSLPLLKPMSEVAGRMSIIMGAFYSAKSQGGRGLLPNGVTGVEAANVVILGGGNVGTNAAKAAAGFGCNVTIFDVNLERLEYLGDIMPPNVKGIYNDPISLEKYLRTADIVIGSALIPGAKTPKLITRDHLKWMQPGTVLVDVAIDQGGCFETSKPTKHDHPTFEVDGIIHYCVANMPGAYARTSTYALCNATTSYGLQLANKGVERACRESPAILAGLNTYKGKVTYPGVAQAFNIPLEDAAAIVKL
ncbi:MAG: alanine dehydrogenase [Termitinemataceae bacterium]|nr:MAG: alanine dehydrogenase [Termitinemataceae bacterium]